MRGVQRLEAWSVRILGVLLILLGITLFVSPRVVYTQRESIPHTQFRIKREKVILVSHPVAVVVAVAGMAALVWARGRAHPQ